MQRELMRSERSGRYQIRRVSLSSVLRMSLALTWLVMLCPALCMAGLIVRAIQAVGQVFAQAQNIQIDLLGQTLANINILQTLGLTSAAATTTRLTENATATFIGLTLILLVGGAVLLTLVALLFGVGYNLLARLGAGLEVELRSKNDE